MISVAGFKDATPEGKNLHWFGRPLDSKVLGCLLKLFVDLLVLPSALVGGVLLLRLPLFGCLLGTGIDHKDYDIGAFGGIGTQQRTRVPLASVDKSRVALMIRALYRMLLIPMPSACRA